MGNSCKIYTLCSGSGGNSAFIRVRDTAILIDAGKSAKKICALLEKIGEKIEDVDAIFVTHEHIDHVSAIETISKKYHIPVHMQTPSAEALLGEGRQAFQSVVCTHALEDRVDVRDVTVSAFRTSHDSKMCVGYRIDFVEDGKPCAVGLATDTGYVSDEVRAGLGGCSAVIIECNHDEDMLMSGPYTYAMKQRVSSRFGHLSNKACADFSAELAESGTKGFILAHLSPKNNDPELALNAVTCAVAHTGASVFVSKSDEPVELLWE